MNIFVVLLDGSRILIEAEKDWTVSQLKQSILEEKSNSLPILPPLAFGNKELEDHLSLKDYNIQRESVIEVRPKQYGGTLTTQTIAKHSSALPLTTAKWEFDYENGKPYISFPPVLDKSEIPFYDAVVHQPYHEDLTAEDEKWIKKYTGIAYEKLKVHAYTLVPDGEQLTFLKGLYLACWAARQLDLPTTVYHMCTLTEKSFSWFSQENLEFITPGFISTSKNPNFKWGDSNCKWEITLTPGKRDHAANVSAISKYKKEEEILLSCCTRFRVLSSRRNYKDYKYYIFMEYLDL
jgi:hypothetical protein